MEDEERDEGQQRSDQQVDDMSSVICKNVHFLLRMMNRVKEPEGPNFMPYKMVKPDKEFSQQQGSNYLQIGRPVWLRCQRLEIPGID